jgi:hypothetical protein
MRLKPCWPFSSLVVCTGSTMASHPQPPKQPQEHGRQSLGAGEASFLGSFYLFSGQPRLYCFRVSFFRDTSVVRAIVANMWGEYRRLGR